MFALSRCSENMCSEGRLSASCTSVINTTQKDPSMMGGRRKEADKGSKGRVEEGGNVGLSNCVQFVEDQNKK